MRVLVVNTVAFDNNGISKHILAYCRRLNQTNFIIDFVVNETIADSSKSQLEGSHFFILSRRKKNLFSYCRELIGIIRQGNYELIHIHGNSATMLVETLSAKLSGKRIKIIAHGHAVHSDHPLFHKVAKKLLGASCDQIFACSHEAGKFICQGDAYRVISNFIEGADFRFKPIKRQELRSKMQLEDQKVLLHVGNFTPAKNHFFLLDLLGALLKTSSNVRLILIGDGELAESVVEYGERLGVNHHVTYLGQLTNPADYYDVADIFVMPSLFESFGTALLEAQCAGLPCYASNRIPSIVKISQDVFFLPIEDSLNEWVRLIHQETCKLESRKKGQIKVKNSPFDADRNVKGLAKLYGEIVWDHTQGDKRWQRNK